MSRNTELDISGHCYLFFFFAASPFLYLQPSCPWARPGPESLIAMAMAVCRGRSVCPVKPAPAAPTAHTTGRVQLCEPLSAGRWLSLRSGSVACLLLSSLLRHPSPPPSAGAVFLPLREDGALGRAPASPRLAPVSSRLLSACVDSPLRARGCCSHPAKTSHSFRVPGSLPSLCVHKSSLSAGNGCWGSRPSRAPAADGT